ncbi:BamA/TamA family outer membrane protein [Arsukibacterium sp.]|uniref:BamA/TamA family outer membrane protein n=1 Tax=Arsukibacterium sp. TaxID=1977258 RepID=UPI002FD9595A
MLKTNRSIICLATLIFCQTARADCTSLFDEEQLAQQGPLTIAAIEYQQNNVFDLSERGIFWLHRFANYSHIITKEQTIRQDLLFAEGDTLDLNELAEAERLLRSRRHLREANISISQYCPDEQQVVVAVQSWDNWSLLPKIDFSSEGGETRYSIGVAEDNLLGSGNQLQLNYSQDSERNGYLLSFASPNLFGSHWSSVSSFANNSDGESYQFGLHRPFYRLSSDWAFSLDLLKNKEQINDYLLAEKVNQYSRTEQQFESFAGFRISEYKGRIHRLNGGITMQDMTFAEQQDTLFAPPDSRNLSSLWLEYQLLEANYRKLFNINQFNRVEDINLGWQASVRLGYLQPMLGADQHGWQIQAKASKVWQLYPDTWLLSEVAYQRLWWQAFQQQLFSSHLQLVHQLNSRSSLVAIAAVDLGQNRFADEGLYLGGDTGLRAFPLFYQRGDNRVVMTTEYRYYTDWNILQIFDVGFAGFADAGRSWGGEQEVNSQIDDKVLFGLGAGIRLLSSHSSRGTMVHIDLTRPFTDNPELTSWQWRVTAKRRF